jgi:acid phosphatase family membrane protein YuiD
MNTCQKEISKKQVILVLCYRRTYHLAQVISALESAYLIESFTVIFVVQDPIESVVEVINSSSIQNKLIIETNGMNYTSSAQAINGNLAIGFEYAFGTLAADYVVVLEDDIVISQDGLCFFQQAFNSNIINKKFRGVNGFSKEVDTSDAQNAYIRLNYGLGWGWAIHKRTYRKLSKYWDGSENEHWDFIFEPYIRTGFVINPIRSRIINIGFDETATHTSGNQELGNEIENSFHKISEDHACAIVETENDFQWIGEITNLSKATKLGAEKVFLLRKLLFLVYVLDGANKSNYHRFRRHLTSRLKQ